MRNLMMVWFSIATAVMTSWGAIVAFLDLTTLPIGGKVLLPWLTGVLGATIMGWGITAFVVGRFAFRRSEPEILKGILYGFIGWFIVDVSFSALLGVAFNVAVDMTVIVLVVYPLAKGIRGLSRAKSRND